jgi:oligosaccharide repeat unit polymerase
VAGVASRVGAGIGTSGEASDSLGRIPPWAITVAAVATAIICGRFFADGHEKYAVALVLGALYAPLVFFDLPAAIAAWTAVLFFKNIRTLSVGPNTMGVLVGVGFIGVFMTRHRILPALVQQRRLVIGIVLLLVWLTFSAAWAIEPGTALSQAGFWWLGGLAFLIVMTTLTRGRDIALVALAFVAGATVSAVIGLASGGLSTGGLASTAGAVGQTAVNGRLTGGGGDPNLQAAGFIAAMFLAMGLFTVYRRWVIRLGLLVAFVLITIAFFATQSRGGLLALAVTTITALILFKGQRRRIFGFIVVAALVATVALAVNPGSLSRITDFGGGTSGRSDIWSVAAKVFAQHPIVGVGLNNFQVVEPHYALMHRSVSRVQYIAETPFPAHNTYLQLLDEVGVIGLLGFLAVAFACLRTSWLAARLFDRAGRRDYGHLARATMLGGLGMLTAIFFFSDGDDWRLWILLGLGPALLALARRLVADRRRSASALVRDHAVARTQQLPHPAAPLQPPAREAWEQLERQLEGPP